MPAQDTLTVLTETVPLYGRVLSAVEGFEQELRRHLRNRLAELGEVLATADIDYDVEQTKITTLDSGSRFLAYAPITRFRTYAGKDESWIRAGISWTPVEGRLMPYAFLGFYFLKSTNVDWKVVLKTTAAKMPAEIEMKTFSNKGERWAEIGFKSNSYYRSALADLDRDLDELGKHAAAAFGGG